MLPGPNEIIQCPHCEEKHIRRTIISANTLGKKTWSDGYSEAPFFPYYPALTKCAKCNGFFWVNDQKAILEYEIGSKKDKYEFTPEVDFLKRHEYFEALESPVNRNENDEQYIRKKIWWAFNDQFRNNDILQFVMSEQDAENIRIYRKYFDKNKPEERMMVAETHRELGEFDKCIELLSYGFDERLFEFAFQIKEKAIQQIRRVFLLQRP